MQLGIFDGDEHEKFSYKVLWKLHCNFPTFKLDHCFDIGAGTGPAGLAMAGPFSAKVET